MDTTGSDKRVWTVEEIIEELVSNNDYKQFVKEHLGRYFNTPENEGVILSWKRWFEGEPMND
jgi:hypothetical protein